MGYWKNEYNWCVMNKTIKVKQCTVLWHVGGMKTSHVDSNVVSRIIADIDTEYINILKTIITWGNIHKYLGMTIN